MAQSSTTKSGSQKAPFPWLAMADRLAFFVFGIPVGVALTLALLGLLP